MREAHVRRMPVVDERGRLTGILALDDIFEHMAQRIPFGVTPIRPERAASIRSAREDGHRQDLNPAPRARHA